MSSQLGLLQPKEGISGSEIWVTAFNGGRGINVRKQIDGDGIGGKVD